MVVVSQTSQCIHPCLRRLTQALSTPCGIPRFVSGRAPRRRPNVSSELALKVFRSKYIICGQFGEYILVIEKVLHVRIQISELCNNLLMLYAVITKRNYVIFSLFRWVFFIQKLLQQREILEEQKRISWHLSNDDDDKLVCAQVFN